MPITSQQMVGILKSRRLQIVPVSNPGSPDKWIAKTIDGSRAGPGNIQFSSPEEAVEAAEERFLQAEKREAESKSQTIVSALEKGKYFVRPREVVTGTGQDRTVTILFDVFDLNGTATSVKDRISFIQAVIDMEKLPI